ncbi:MAG TPA: hypothetical protein VLF67_03050 [Candidatus Saccharimonas sp.]|nr:hypothetical protein [Candidatus Saccharimonas sp.]
MPERLKEANDRFPDLPADLRELDHDGQIELFNAAAAWLANTEVEEKPDRSTPQNVKRTRTVYLQTADGRGVKVQEVQEDERVTPLGGQPRLDHIEPVVSIDLQYNPGERAANIPAPMLVREGYNKTYASFPILGHDAELIISSLKDATRITEDEYRKLVPAAGNGESAGSRAVSQQNRVVVGNQRGQAVRDEWEADARARRRAANGARDAA